MGVYFHSSLAQRETAELIRKKSSECTAGAYKSETKDHGVSRASSCFIVDSSSVARLGT
jgi:hypothetical protein